MVSTLVCTLMIFAVFDLSIVVISKISVMLVAIIYAWKSDWTMLRGPHYLRTTMQITFIFVTLEITNIQIDNFQLECNWNDRATLRFDTTDLIQHIPRDTSLPAPHNTVPPDSMVPLNYLVHVAPCAWVRLHTISYYPCAGPGHHMFLWRKLGQLFSCHTI